MGLLDVYHQDFVGELIAKVHLLILAYLKETSTSKSDRDPTWDNTKSIKYFSICRLLDNFLFCDSVIVYNNNLIDYESVMDGYHDVVIDYEMNVID